jgi:transcriptional regulator with XRE-family HTH domain
MGRRATPKVKRKSSTTKAFVAKSVGGKAGSRGGASRGYAVKSLPAGKTSGPPKPADAAVGRKAGGAMKSVGVSVAEIRQLLGLSQEEFARVTGYSTRSVAGWESGHAVSDSARQKLNETARLRAALTEIVPPGSLGDWLRTPNPAFEGQTPIQVIERGESDRLWQMIFQIDANVAN